MKGYFSKEFKKGLKFSVYFYIGITIASLCIAPFVFSSSPYLILPFSLLISHPIAWLILGIVFVVGAGLVFSVTKSLFQSIKGFVNERKINNTNKNTESERLIKSENESKTINRESGVITLEDDISNNIESDNVYDQSCFVSETQNKGFAFHLSNMNIIDIAKAQYGWVGTRNKKGDKDLSQGVYFTCCHNSSQLKAQLQEYINSVKQGNSNLIFTSILCINNNHWVTLVIAHDSDNKKFTACYCDSFSNSIPEDLEKVVSELSKNRGYSIEIKHSEATQQKDSINCGVFALKNAQIMTDNFKEKKPPSESITQLKYNLSTEELEKMRREFANSIKRDRRGIKNNDTIILTSEKTDESSRSRKSSGDSGFSSDSEQIKTTKVIKYSTVGDGNCFFHAVFGERNNILSQYEIKTATEMRAEWHNFLSQFKSLDDPEMPISLKNQLQKIFSIFLNKSGDLTGVCDAIKHLAKEINDRIKDADSKVKDLKKTIIKKFYVHSYFRDAAYIIIKEAINQHNNRCPNDQKPILNVQSLLNDKKKLRNEIQQDLESFALILIPNLTKEKYCNTYNPEVIKDSFLNSSKLYKGYLEAILSNNYYIFIEEIPILASLANIEIEVHYNNNSHNTHTVFEPNPKMLNEKYKENNVFVWSNKKQETIYLHSSHYERAEVVNNNTPKSYVEQIRGFCYDILQNIVNSVSYLHK